MVSFHLANPRRSRVLLLVVLLLLTLGLAGVLAYQAQDAARSHRSAAENTLRDYAAFAAWEFARLSRSHLYCMAQSTMLPFPQRLDASTALPEPTPELWDEACDCHIDADYFFRFDARDRTLVTTGGSPPPMERTRVVEALASSLSAPHDTDSPPSLLLAHLDGGMRVLVYRIAREHGEPVAIYGAAGPLEELRERLGQAFAEAVPLPPSLAGDVVTDSVVALSILAGDHEAYRSGPAEPPTYAAEDTLGLRYGGLVARATLRPEVAQTLLIGGLPRSRLPVLIGLFVLAAALVAVALVQLRREYELSRLRDGFVSGVSHELRTPLAQIRMFAETLLLGRTRSEGEQRRSLEIIDQEAGRLGQLVENVLQFSRSERGAARIDAQAADLAPEVRQAIEGFAPLARARNVSLRLELTDGVYALVDRGAIRQVLLNLLDNAVKYGPAGQTVTVGLEQTNGTGRIRVEDQGPGIPTDEREHIWTAFRRLERDEAGGIAGAGIGLSVVRELVRLHGGRVSTEAAPGGGARFLVELPAVPRANGKTNGAAEQGSRSQERIREPASVAP